MKFLKRLSTVLKIVLKVAVTAEELGLIKTKGVIKKVDAVVEAGEEAAKK